MSQMTHIPLSHNGLNGNGPDGETGDIMGSPIDATASQRFERETQLLQELAGAVGELPDLNSALAIALKQACQLSGWDYGEAWIPSADGTNLIPCPIWYGCTSNLQDFRRHTEELRLSRYADLAGLVWQSHQLEWLAETAHWEQLSSPRREAMLAAGFQAGLGVPLCWGEKLLAVLVFLTSVRKPDDRRFGDLMAAMANHLSAAIHNTLTEGALREAEQKYRSIFENAVEGIYLMTPQGGYLEANPMLARILRYSSPADLIASVTDVRQQLYVDPERWDEFTRLLAVGEAAVQGFESAVRCRDGTIIWIAENARAVRDKDGRAIAYEGTVVDISTQRHDRETIEFMAYYDLLTELPNRVLLNDRLTLALAQAKRNEEMLAVMFIDLDQFKTVNDTLGHDVGDILLQEVAIRLSSCLRKGDTIARWGGDEFTLLLPQAVTTEGVVKLAQRILQAFESPFDCAGHELHISCSIGIAIHPQDGSTFQTLFKNADTALYRAKEQGRNTYQLYSPAMHAQATARLKLENGLRQAIERQEFELHYQPQVHLESGRIVGVEALLRWHHPDLGLLTPNTFIAIAEDTGTIVPIGEWVLQAACQQLKQWHVAGVKSLRMAVNLSAKQFQQPNLLESVSQALAASGLESHALELEITESIAIRDVDRTSQQLHDLRKMGVHIAIDDFGTGYSSISYLRRFPFDTLKIDRSFIQDVSHNDSAAALAKAVVMLGRGLNLQLLAEGVETQAQLDFLRSLQCDLAQGYWFSKPLPAALLTALLLPTQLPVPPEPSLSGNPASPQG